MTDIFAAAERLNDRLTKRRGVGAVRYEISSSPGIKQPTIKVTMDSFAVSGLLDQMDYRDEIILRLINALDRVAGELDQVADAEYLARELALNAPQTGALRRVMTDPR